jgi:signal transduction histidine kinase/PAS domain-containing protein
MALQALRGIARALSNPLTPRQVADVVVDKIHERFGAPLSVVYLAESNGEATLLASRGLSEASRSRLARVPMAADLPLTVAMRQGEPVYCESRAALLARYPHLAESGTPADHMRAVIAVPFSIDHHVLGGFALSFDTELPLDALQQEVLSTIGDLAAHAIDRYRLEQRFRTMHETNPDGVAVARPLRDESGTIVDFQYAYVNPAVARAMGRAPAELVGRTFLECLPGLNRTSFWPAFCRVANTGKHETYEQGYDENGWSGWYRNTVVSLGDEIAITYSDVTAQKRAERSVRLLAESSKVLSSSLDYDTTLASLAKLAVPQIADWATVDMLDANGRVNRLAVAHVDPAKVALGYEVTRRFPIDRNAPHGLARVLRTGEPEMVAEITDALVQASVVDEELLAILRDIGLRSTICVPLKARGRVVGAMSLFAAESGRHYTRDDLELVEELASRASAAIENAMFYRAAEEANQAKDEFLAVVSHELRTPLNAIIGWTHMLREEKLAPERRARALEVIERNAWLQNQLIEDLLDVSRIVSDKLRIDARTVDLPLVIERAIETVRPTASAKQIAIRQEVDASAPPVFGDPDRLQQVVWNLVNNAVKFSDNGSTIDVVLRRTDGAVEIAVKDEGRGIDPAFLPHVFERFRQADSSTTRSRGGLGLGLAIVRKLVELHGGTVRAESEGVRRGATFTVRLPIDAPRTPSLFSPPAIQLMAANPAFRYPPEVEGIHVLVVDDEQDARDLIATLLSRCKVKVSTASNVRDALRIVESERPTVIVSDIGMPNEDGYSLIRKLRALPAARGGSTPAIALTAYARTEERTKTLVAGFNMHVPKPVEPTELLAVLASLAAVLRT